MCRIDLLNKISMFFNPTFQDFYSWGLPKNITNEAVIILAINNLQKHKKYLFYYDFKKKYNNKPKNINYNIIDDEESYLNDIPKLDMNSPEGFSIFVSDWEKEFIKENSKNIKHLKEKNKRKLDINELDIKVKYILNNFLLYIQKEIEPYKHHFICQLCKSKFDNYQKHLKSNLHLQKMKENNEIFKGIKNTFIRISEYYKKLENKKIENIINKKNKSDKKNLLKDKRANDKLD